MSGIPIWTLEQLGFTHHQVRTVMEGFNRGDTDYAWVAATLVASGAKKPQVDAERFIEAYRQFRIGQLDTAMDRIRNRLHEWRTEGRPQSDRSATAESDATSCSSTEQ